MPLNVFRASWQSPITILKDPRVTVIDFLCLTPCHSLPLSREKVSGDGNQNEKALTKRNDQSLGTGGQRESTAPPGRAARRKSEAGPRQGRTPPGARVGW